MKPCDICLSTPHINTCKERTASAITEIFVILILYSKTEELAGLVSA